MPVFPFCRAIAIFLWIRLSQGVCMGQCNLLDPLLSRRMLCVRISTATTQP